MKAKLNYMIEDWRTNKAQVYKVYELEADSKEELFKKAYPYERELRYCNGHYVEFADAYLNKEFREWKMHTSVEMYYGNATVD